MLNLLHINFRKHSLQQGTQSVNSLVRKPHIIKFIDTSSDEDEMSERAKEITQSRQDERERVRRLGKMVPLQELESNSLPGPTTPIPLLPKPALTQLLCTDNISTAGGRQPTKNSVRSDSYLIAARGPSKNVSFDYVEVLEFSDNDDEEVPDHLTEEELAEAKSLDDEIAPLKIS